MKRIYQVLDSLPDYRLRPFIIGILWFGVACAAACVRLTFAPLEPVGAILAGCSAGACPVSLAVTASISRPFVQDMAGIRQGAFLLHWTYTRDEWQRFSELELGRGHT